MSSTNHSKTARCASPGKLYYVIGASGVGKDSLLNYSRRFLGAEPVLFAHRYITRPVELTGENHIHLSAIEFSTRLRQGCFLFDWQSHDLHYGIGVEVQAWLDLGLNVVLNGSREYLDEATAKIPDLRPVLITVSLDKLRQRLESRGRETAIQINERLQRAQQFDDLTPAHYPNLRVISNDEALEVAGQKLVKLFQQK